MAARRSPGEPEIRRATPDQAEQLTAVAIVSKAHWGYDDEFMARFASVITITSGYVRQNEVWIVAEGGEIAGFYALLDYGEMGELDHLWLLPAHIGKGFGRLLFEHAAGRARDLGNRRLEWEAEPNAIGFYERMGGRTDRETMGQLGRPLKVMTLEVAIDKRMRASETT
jgi:GNAT superfamily N-acetyltransferase